jgi:hypothetical protein
MELFLGNTVLFLEEMKSHLMIIVEQFIGKFNARQTHFTTLRLDTIDAMIRGVRFVM